MIDVRDYAPPGTKRDGVADWTAYIQAAIDHVVSQPIDCESGTVYLPPGRYRITAPLIVKPPVGGSFCSASLRGDGIGYGNAQFHGSAIECHFPNKDQSAIVLQSVRAVTVENLVIVGQNAWDIVHNAASMAVLADDTSFVLPGVRDNRRSPHAAVAVDPLTAGVDQADQYPGLGALYIQRSGSSAIEIRGCEFRGFVVGIALALGESQNAEDVFIDRCRMVGTKSAVAIGQGQSRNVTMSSISVYASRTVIDCVNYGDGNGSAPMLFGANVNCVKHIVQTSSWGGAFSATGIVAENLYSIGVIGGSTVSDPSAFVGCRFKFAPSPQGGKAIPSRLANIGVASFSGCTFGIGDPSEPMWMSTSNRLTFSACGFESNTGDGSARLWINGSAARSVRFDNCNMTTTPYRATLGDVVVDHMANLYDYPVTPGALLRSTDDGLPLRHVSTRAPSVWLGTASVVVFDDGTAEFFAQSPYSRRVAPGDFLFALTSTWPLAGDAYQGQQSAAVIGKVFAVDATTGRVQIRYVPSYVPSGQLPPQYLYARWLPRVHRPTQGVALAGSAEVAILQAYLGHWRAGEHVRDREGRFAYGTWIVSIGSDKLTMSAPSASSGPVNLYDADVREFVTSPVLQ